jgi:hypothetical protein
VGVLERDMGKKVEGLIIGLLIIIAFVGFCIETGFNWGESVSALAGIAVGLFIGGFIIDLHWQKWEQNKLLKLNSVIEGNIYSLSAFVDEIVAGDFEVRRVESNDETESP